MPNLQKRRNNYCSQKTLLLFSTCWWKFKPYGVSLSFPLLQVPCLIENSKAWKRICLQMQNSLVEKQTQPERSSLNFHGNCLFHDKIPKFKLVEEIKGPKSQKLSEEAPKTTLTTPKQKHEQMPSIMKLRRFYLVLTITLLSLVCLFF